MNRRDFFKRAAGALTAALPDLACAVRRQRRDSLWPSNLDADPVTFPYDAELFEAAERFVFLGQSEAVLNVIPKQGRILDIRLYRSPSENSIAGGSVQAYSGLKDSLDIPILVPSLEPEFRYRLEYRESGTGSWKSTPERWVKTPASYLRTGRLEAIFISDDHTFDDADQGTRIVRDPLLCQQRLSGEYVNFILKELAKNPDYYPAPDSDLRKTLNAFMMASTLLTILKYEHPDFIILGGDSTGIGAPYKWEGLGLKSPASGLSEQEVDDYAKLFWLRMRRIFSALTPSIPIYLCQGNHDGESGYDPAKNQARKYRKKYFKQPGLRQGGAAEENYFPLFWGAETVGKGAPLFLVLDNESYNPVSPSKAEDWTIGAGQKDWLKNALRYETDWKFVFFHHVLGGWPRGSNEEEVEYAYGRGPLYIAPDYEGYAADPNLVEQVELTKIMRDRGVSVHFYGHDHIFHVREIPALSGGTARKMYGVRLGSPKWFGEDYWYKGPLWQKHYGSCGHYQADPQPVSLQTDFWGPSGYTKLTLDKDIVRVKYVRSADNHPWTNIPPGIGVGATVASHILSF